MKRFFVTLAVVASVSVALSSCGDVVREVIADADKSGHYREFINNTDFDEMERKAQAGKKYDKKPAHVEFNDEKAQDNSSLMELIQAERNRKAVRKGKVPTEQSKKSQKNAVAKDSLQAKPADACAVCDSICVGE